MTYPPDEDPAPSRAREPYGPTPHRHRPYLRAVIFSAMTVVLIVILWHITGLLLNRHRTADRCRAAGYTWLGGYVNKCIDAPEVNP